MKTNLFEDKDKNKKIALFETPEEIVRQMQKLVKIKNNE